MDEILLIVQNTLTLEEVNQIISKKRKLRLSPLSKKLILDCRKYLNEKMEITQNLYYGINTGFGALCNVGINEKEIQNLQGDHSNKKP